MAQILRLWPCISTLTVHFLLQLAIDSRSPTRYNQDIFSMVLMRRPHFVSNVKRLLLGLGLDNTDGHVRMTRGENFRLFGGSQETHEVMQEHAIKINEKLKERQKTLDTVSEKEFRDIASEVGLKKVE